MQNLCKYLQGMFSGPPGRGNGTVVHVAEGAGIAVLLCCSCPAGHHKSWQTATIRECAEATQVADLG